jgi:hypothetical protein
MCYALCYALCPPCARALSRVRRDSWRMRQTVERSLAPLTGSRLPSSTSHNPAQKTSLFKILPYRKTSLFKISPNSKTSLFKIFPYRQAPLKYSLSLQTSQAESRKNWQHWSWQKQFEILFTKTSKPYLIAFKLTCIYWRVSRTYFA